MQPNKKPFLYRLVWGAVDMVYPEIELVGLENLPDSPSVLVGNHAQAHGPIISEERFPFPHYTWCAAEMLHREDLADYAYRDFWSKKPAWSLWFYRLLSHLIAPLSEHIFTNADTIGVYKDGRALSTFKNTVKRLEEGANVIIFPEHDVPHNHIVCDFQNKFIDVARLYYKRTGKALTFVPMYIAPNLNLMALGEGTAFRPDVPMEEERERICNYLMDAITEKALSLPAHKVVPYPNMPSRIYPMSK